jgi:hypothetical protein
MLDEQRLLEKLRRVEALFAGAYAQGEKDAAANAIERIRERLAKLQTEDKPVEFRFTMQDMWSRKLLVALLRRYGITPYRFHGQRYTTVMAQVPKSFVNQTLWPEFEQLSEVLRNYLDEVTERLISQSIHSDASEAEVRTDVGQKALTGPDN